jgi:hypothetical protein
MIKKYSLLSSVMLSFVATSVLAALSPATQPVKGHAPVADSIKIEPNTPKVGDVLTGSYAYTDIDGDTEEGTIVKWLRDDVEISGASAINYTVTADDAGKNISLQITPKSSAPADPDQGLSVTSENITVLQAAPAKLDNFILPDIQLRTWNDADSYCKSLGARLPTEDELLRVSTHYPDGMICTKYGWPSHGACGVDSNIYPYYWTSSETVPGEHLPVYQIIAIDTSTRSNNKATAVNYTVCVES